MELSNEQMVTKILSEYSILHNSIKRSINTNSTYNLGDFLSNSKRTSEICGDKYIFIR